MSHFSTRANVSIVTAVVSPATANALIDNLFEMGEQNALVFNARGTLIRKRWIQNFLPVISPELEYVQLLVPDPQVDRIMEMIGSIGRLHLPGAGAVFSVPCDEVAFGDDFSLWSSLEDDESFNASTNLKENLTAIFCIAQSDQVEAISRAAMNAGAHGPVIFYCEGRGLRDRLGWLKITKKATKEVITVIVDNVDKIAVTEAMIEAGNLDAPGRGFLYRMPVQKGLVNLPSEVGNRGYTANMQQVIAAIDGIMGSTDWRDQSVIELGMAGKGAGLSSLGRFKEREWLEAQVCLGVIASRSDADLLLDTVLEAGAKGANISYARFIEVESERTATGVRLNRERGIIRSVIDRTLASQVKEAIRERCERESITDVCVFAQPVTRAFTYIAPESASTPPQRTYRGAVISDS